MLSYAQFINESLNDAVPYKWVKHGIGKVAARHMHAAFMVKGKKYRTYFVPIKAIKDNAYTVDFEYRGDGDESRLDTTGTGDEFKVFATVAKQSAEFIKQMKPNELQFTTDDPARQRLYVKFAARLARETGYKVATATNGIYILTKR